MLQGQLGVEWPGEQLVDALACDPPRDPGVALVDDQAVDDVERDRERLGVDVYACERAAARDVRFVGCPPPDEADRSVVGRAA